MQYQDTGAVRAPSAAENVAAPALPTSDRRPGGRGALLLAALLAAAAAALVFTQFTGAARGDQTGQIRQVVKTYERAIVSGDGATACRQLTRDAMQDLIRMSSGVGQGSTCDEVARSMKRYVDAIVAQAPSADRAAAARRTIENPPVEVDSVKGDAATAHVSGQAARPIHLVRAGDGWKISGFNLPGQ